MQIEKAHNIPHETLLTNNKTIKDRKLLIIVTIKIYPTLKKQLMTIGTYSSTKQYLIIFPKNQELSTEGIKT